MLPPPVGRFLAGQTSPAALEHGRQLDRKNVGTVLHLVGQHHDSRLAAAADAAAYRRLIGDIAATDLRACLSVKPTQLGLDVDEAYFRETLDTVIECARDHGVFVWLDTEDSTTTDPTLDAFEHHAREYSGIGVCVRSNRGRTREDLARLADLPGKVQLVESGNALPDLIGSRADGRTDEAMAEHLRYMFCHFDTGIAVGSHSPATIALTADLHERYGTPYAIQMLMGVRTQAQYELAKHHDLWQYVPYGTDWTAYLVHKLAKQKTSARSVLRALDPLSTQLTTNDTVGKQKNSLAFRPEGK